MLLDVSSPSPSSILLGLWCLQLCQPSTERDHGSIPDRNNSNTTTYKCKKNNNNSFLSLAECLSSGARQLSLQSTYKNNIEKNNGNENEYENSNKTNCTDDDKEEKVIKDAIIDKIVSIFNNLFQSCVGSSGQSYLLLHYLRDLVEENHNDHIHNNNVNPDDLKNNNNSKNNESKCNITEIKTIIYFLLSSMNLISIQYHPRLFFIISWLVKEENTEHSSDSHILKISKDSSILNYSLLQARKEKTNKFENANMIINTKNQIEKENFVENDQVTELLKNFFQSRINLIFSPESNFKLNSTALQAQGLLLSKVFAKVRKCHMVDFIIIVAVIIFIIVVVVIIIFVIIIIVTIIIITIIIVITVIITTFIIFVIVIIIVAI